MKKTSTLKMKAKQHDGLAPEYRFEYGQAKLNRFVKSTAPESIAVLLDPDVAKVFETGDSVNAILRALMANMPDGRNSSR